MDRLREGGVLVAALAYAYHHRVFSVKILMGVIQILLSAAFQGADDSCSRAVARYARGGLPLGVFLPYLVAMTTGYPSSDLVLSNGFALLMFVVAAEVLKLFKSGDKAGPLGLWVLMCVAARMVDPDASMAPWVPFLLPHAVVAFTFTTLALTVPAALSLPEMIIVSQGALFIPWATQDKATRFTLAAAFAPLVAILATLPAIMSIQPSRPALRSLVTVLGFGAAASATFYALGNGDATGALRLWASYVFSPSHQRVLLFWAAVLGGFFVVQQLIFRAKLLTDRASPESRKLFHILAIVLFLPVMASDPPFLSLAFAVAMGLFAIIEFVRYWHLPPLGRPLNAFLGAFVDARDKEVYTTHAMLLLGCAIPVWLSGTAAPLPPRAYAGILSVCVGDTCAAVLGRRFGGRCWPESRKTIAGTVACFGSQMAAMLVLRATLVPGMDCARFAAPVALVSLLEAFTNQVDNLVLPLFLFALMSL